MSTRSDASAEDRELFAAIFACWCHNPVATFSLCLLAQAYDVSAELVKEVAEVEITVGFLMQVRARTESWFWLDVYLLVMFNFHAHLMFLHVAPNPQAGA